MGAGHDHLRRSEAGFGGELRPQRSEARARLDDRAEDPPRQAEPLEHAEGPVVGLWIETLRGRGIRPFVRPLVRKEPVKQIGDHQQPVGGGEHGRVGVAHGQELVERIELHELQARGREDLRAGHRRLGLREHSAGARIAIADGLAEQLVVGTEKGEIDAPGIDADARHVRAVPTSREPQPLHHFLPQPRQIPDEPAAERHRPVLEPMNLLEFEQPPVERAGHHPASRSSQIHRQGDRPRHCTCLRGTFPSNRECRITTRPRVE